MITQKEITALDFDTIEEYFNYIYESYINGQITQAKELTAKLSAEQKKTCMEHIHTLFYYDAVDNEDENYIDDSEIIFYKKVGLLK